MAEITVDFLRTELAAAEQRRDQKLADLNLELGRVDLLRALLAHAETPEPKPVFQKPDPPG